MHRCVAGPADGRHRRGGRPAATPAGPSATSSRRRCWPPTSVSTSSGSASTTVPTRSVRTRGGAGGDREADVQIRLGSAVTVLSSDDPVLGTVTTRPPQRSSPPKPLCTRPGVAQRETAKGRPMSPWGPGAEPLSRTGRSHGAVSRRANTCALRVGMRSGWLSSGGVRGRVASWRWRRRSRRGSPPAGSGCRPR